MRSNYSRIKLDFNAADSTTHSSNGLHNYRFNINVQKNKFCKGYLDHDYRQLFRDQNNPLLKDLDGQVSQSIDSIVRNLKAWCEDFLKTQQSPLNQQAKFPDMSPMGQSDFDNGPRRFVYDPTMYSRPLNFATMIRLSKESPVCSKNLVRFLQEIATEHESTQLVTKIEADLPACIGNENVCYVVKFLAKSVSTTQQLAVDYAYQNLDDMLSSIHSSRLLFSLCSHSQNFRNKLLTLCQKKYRYMLSSLPGAILLSLLLSKAENLDKFGFLLSDLYANPSIIRLKFFGRAFAFFMMKCTQVELEQIAEVFQHHVMYLLHDSYGNFLLQIFYERQCLTGIQLCEEALKSFPKKALLRKYCRYVLFKAILHENDGSLSSLLVSTCCHDKKYLEIVFTQRQPTAILLLALSKTKGEHQRVVFAQSILRLSRKVCNSDATNMLVAIIEAST